MGRRFITKRQSGGHAARSRGVESRQQGESLCMMWSCHQYMAGHDRALEANPTLPFATAPELFLDPGRGIESRVRSYLGFKNKEKIETKGPVMRGVRGADLWMLARRRSISSHNVDTRSS